MVNKVVVTDLQQFCHKLVEHQVPVVRKVSVKDQKKSQLSYKKNDKKMMLNTQQAVYHHIKYSSMT